MTHHVTFHLGLPCSMKYPIRGFWYTKGIQRLIISYIWVQKLPCFTTDQFRYSFYCVSVKWWAVLEKMPTVSLHVSAKGHVPWLPCSWATKFVNLFCSGSPRKYHCQILFNSGGMLKVSIKCLQGKLATSRVIFWRIKFTFVEGTFLWKLAQWYTIGDTLDEQQTLTDPSSSLWALCSDEL